MVVDVVMVVVFGMGFFFGGFVSVGDVLGGVDLLFGVLVSGWKKFLVMFGGLVLNVGCSVVLCVFGLFGVFGGMFVFGFGVVVVVCCECCAGVYVGVLGLVLCFLGGWWSA